MEQITFQKLTDQMTKHYHAGDYASALDVVERSAERFPQFSTRTTFWKMCLLSLCGRTEDVISVFQHGLDSGLWWSQKRFQDTDLDAVRDLPEFKRLMEISQKKYQALRMQIE